MALYLAIDLGGTKTEYALAEDDVELARLRGGSIKRLRVDESTAAANFTAALADLRAQTGIDLRRIRRACVGAAGISVPLVADWVRQAIAEHIGSELLLVGDVEIALDAAFFGGPGILTMAGTGSNVAGRTPAGELLTAGGWGPALADQASGHRIGEQALRDVFLAIDEQRSTSLLPEILNLWKLHSIDDLVATANGLPAPDLTQLAPVVVRCAEAGDSVAREVLQREGRELAHLTQLVLQRVRDAQPDTAWLPEVACTGSILQHAAPLRAAFAAALRASFPDLLLRPGVVDPIAGALWRARQQTSPSL